VGDTLWIYSGQDSYAPLIGKYNNNQLPPDTLYGGIAVYVELITDNSNVGEGFVANYWLGDQTGILELQRAGSVLVYPNPFSNTTMIEFPEAISGAYTLIITDILGKERRMINNITQGKFELRKGNLVNGVYLIELRGENLYRGKIVVH
jgi:hypothetical protein